MWSISLEEHAKLTLVGSLGIKIPHGILTKFVRIVPKPFACAPKVKSRLWSLEHQWRNPKIIMTVATYIWWICQNGTVTRRNPDTILINNLQDEEFHVVVVFPFLLLLLCLILIKMVALWSLQKQRVRLSTATAATTTLVVFIIRIWEIFRLQNESWMIWLEI